MAKSAVTILTLLVLLVGLVSLGEMRSARCCTRYNEKPVPVSMLRDYVPQRITGYCNIDAVIFFTNISKRVCANPKDKWVRKAMDIIDSRKAEP
ncbi:C-C motif chemokine 26-like [Brienomyrus brachyistius]|uniref:C-C motif chemokine 26-like n=1 Tax=Brienomyrus brachyistius TaxID=42636 RepID=UPI0020B1B976|nr:C-C motif chemokine 26-like [Brienomyrus brachyistius]